MSFAYHAIADHGLAIMHMGGGGMTMDKPPPHMDGKFVAVIACCFSVLWGTQ